jgi:hypothetical protein
VTADRVEVTGSGSSGGSGERTANASASFSGQAGIGFKVTVSGAAVPYRAEGTLTGPGTIFYIFKSGAGPFVELVQNQTYDRSGTLAPGTYEIAMGASCSADQPATCSNAYDSSLILGG